MSLQSTNFLHLTVDSSHKAKCRNKREKEIWNELLQLEEDCNLTNNQTLVTEYEICKKKMEDHPNRKKLMVQY